MLGALTWRLGKGWEAAGAVEAGSTPRYRFEWQVIYYLPKPLALPKGTRVEITAHWDNSANNPRNPDPTQSVTWGNQSTDEMLSVPMGVLLPSGA